MSFSMGTENIERCETHESKWHDDSSIVASNSTVWPGDQTPLQKGVVLRWENAWFGGTRVSPLFLTHHEQTVP